MPIKEVTTNNSIPQTNKRNQKGDQQPRTKNQQPRINNTKPQLHSPVNYKYISKETIGQIIGRKIPKQFIPTKRVGTIFGIIFFLVVIIAFLKFPYGSFMSGNIDVSIELGYPMTFLEMKLSGENSNVNTINLILDLIIYILLTYLIEILINLIMNNPLVESEEKKRTHPVIFRNKEETASDKITKKVFGKQKTPSPNSNNKTKNTSN